MKKLIILVMFIIINFLYCTLDFPDDPKPPTWDIAVTKIPILTGDTLSLGDKLKPKDFNRIDADSTLAVEFDHNKNFDIGGKLKISALTNKHFSDKLGNFKISATKKITQNITFIEIYPSSSNLLGTNTVVPGAPLGLIEKKYFF